MTRTVAALYDSRAEAELARARLLAQSRAKAPRIIARDTAGAIDGMNFAPKDVETYREGVRRGGHLLVAQVPRGTSPRKVVDLLKTPMGDSVRDEADAPPSEISEGGVQVEFASEQAEVAAPPPMQAAPPTRTESGHEIAPVEPGPAPARPAPAPEATAAARVAAPSASGDELRIGRRAFTRETPAEEQVSLRDEVVEVETRPAERRLTDSEVEAAGLFKERVIEIAEMREEPVVTKIAMVREEVIVRKRVQERTETVRETVRRTDVEVENAPAPEGDRPTFFRRGPTGPRQPKS